MGKNSTTRKKKSTKEDKTWTQERVIHRIQVPPSTGTDFSEPNFFDILNREEHFTAATMEADMETDHLKREVLGELAVKAEDMKLVEEEAGALKTVEAVDGGCVEHNNTTSLLERLLEFALAWAKSQKKAEAQGHH